MEDLETHHSSVGASQAPRCIVATQMREVGFSGNQTHAAAVIKMAALAGWDITLVNPFSGRFLFRNPVFALRFVVKYLGSAVDIFWYRLGHGRYLEAALRQEIARDSRPTVIYAQDPQSADAALKVRRPGVDSVVLIIHFNDSQAEEWVLRGMIRRHGWLYRKIAALEERVLPRVDKLIYVSEFMKRRLEARIPAIRQVSSSVIPNFVEVPQVHPDAAPGDLIAVGTLEARKNQEYILRVIGELKSRGSHIRLTLAGGGGDEQKLRRLAEELGIDAQIRFLGNTHNAAGHLASHRIQVHAALAENCPIALIEGMACGLPIVAAAVGGIPEMLNEHTGAFWNLDSVSEGADTIQNLLGSPEQMAAASTYCKTRYNQFYSTEVCGGLLLSAFEQSLQSCASVRR